jgi:hypothetical protein
LGQTINVTGKIRNQGGLDAGPFTSQYYLSADDQITAADIPLGNPFTTNSLAPFVTHSDTRTLAVPNAAEGDWYVGLIAWR